MLCGWLDLMIESFPTELIHCSSPLSTSLLESSIFKNKSKPLHFSFRTGISCYCKMIYLKQRVVVKESVGRYHTKKFKEKVVLVLGI